MTSFKKALAILIISASVIYPQIPDKAYFEKNLEVYFEFNVNEASELNILTRIISIDNVTGSTVKAYANYYEWQDFLKLNYNYKLLPHPGDVGEVKMSDNLKELGTWDSYPTYEGYLAMMNQYAAAYPSLCRIVDAGTTVNGRKILFAVISDNVGVRENEPQIMLSSTIHGDETTGYVLMLHLIDSLLTSYGINPRTTNLVDNAEIWINPDANPDGTYYGGNSTVNGARRYNANGKDLNRNFPDPAAGPNPTGTWQPETLTMMALADSNRYVLSVNFHGGAEVVNYPWDCWPRLHPDNDWYVQISRKYADTAQANSPTGYLNDFNNGITNGYAWYSVYGGRQDYFTYFKRGREVTIELSAAKLLSPSLLPAHWNYNKKSFLGYMENCLYGIRGTVTDTSGIPLKAKITVVGHDYDSTEVITDLPHGNYYRMIDPGTYTISVSADSCITQIINNVVVQQNNTTVLNVQLVRMYTPVQLVSFNADVSGNNILLTWHTATELNNNGFYIERKTSNSEWQTVDFVKGHGTTSEPSHYSYTNSCLSPGHYYYRLRQEDFDGSITYSAASDAEIFPFSFMLFQNYPNPFNPSTTIKYSLGEQSRISLRVFDVLGSEIMVIADEQQKEGYHEVRFDASGFSSGIYILRLYAASSSGKNIELYRKINIIK